MNENTPLAPERRTPPLPLFYSSAYGSAAFAFDTTRKGGWVAESLERRPIAGVALSTPELPSVAELERVHDRRYVDALRTGEPRSLAQSDGFEWDAGIWTAVLASTSGFVRGAQRAVRERCNAGSLSSGMHHARAGAGNAFCSLNGLAMAARVLLDAGAERLLILDLDAHCAGGTYSIVRDWPRVVHIDVAVSAFDSYRPRAGSSSTLDIVQSADAYLPTIERRLDALTHTRFDAVLYGAGMDPHQGSPGGCDGVTSGLLARRERLVFEWARERRVPVAFCLLGGYTGVRLSVEDLFELHRLTIAAAAQERRGTPRF